MTKEEEAIKMKFFITACETNNVEQVRSLLKENNNYSEWCYNSTLYSCVMRGHSEIVKLLIESGANPARNNNELIQNASCAGSFNIVQYLLKDKRVDPTSSDNYAIIKAHTRGENDVVKLLFSQPNVRKSLVESNSELYNLLMKKYIKNKVSKF